MAKFIYELEDEIIEKIVVQSNMPFVSILGKVLEYDEYFNHQPKTMELPFSEEDIAYTIKNSHKLYYCFRDGKYIIGMDDGAGLIFYSNFLESGIEIIHIQSYERDEINYPQKMNMEDLLEKINSINKDFEENQEIHTGIIAKKMNNIIDSDVDNLEEELVVDLVTKLKNDYVAYKVKI